MVPKRLAAALRARSRTSMSRTSRPSRLSITEALPQRVGAAGLTVGAERRAVATTLGATAVVGSVAVVEALAEAGT